MFSSSEFLDLGSRKAVDIALLRLTKAGTIRRLTRGLYYFPKTSPLLGELHPTVEAVAKAIEARDHEPSFKVSRRWRWGAALGTGIGWGSSKTFRSAYIETATRCARTWAGLRAPK